MKKTVDINKYIKVIVNNLFPILESNYQIQMYPDPISVRPGVATFTGKDLKEERVMLEFNSNHKVLETDNDDVYISCFYKTSGNAAGPCSLASNIEETAEKIYAALYRIGCRSSQDLSQDEQNQQAEKEKQRKAEEEKQRKAREKYQANRANIEYNKNLDKEENNEEPEVDVEPERTFSEVLNDSIVELQRRNQINSSIHIAFRGEKEFSIDCYYISKNSFYLKSDDLDLDKTSRVDEMVTYLNDLSQKYKVTSCNTYEAPDPNNKDAERGISVNLF